MKFSEQKLNYIHANPCRGVWSLVDDPCDYPHSSAKFYATGKQGSYAVTNFMELEDVDLTKPFIEGDRSAIRRVPETGDSAGT